MLSVQFPGNIFGIFGKQITQDFHVALFTCNQSKPQYYTKVPLVPVISGDRVVIFDAITQYTEFEEVQVFDFTKARFDNNMFVVPYTMYKVSQTFVNRLQRTITLIVCRTNKIKHVGKAYDRTNNIGYKFVSLKRINRIVSWSDDYRIVVRK